jgi:hypothetical protein
MCLFHRLPAQGREEHNMFTYEIPLEQWQPFLSHFTDLHQGDRVDVERIGGSTAPRAEFCDQPLVAVSVLGRESSSEEVCIEVAAGNEVTPKRHTIHRASQVSVTQREDGYPTELKISAHDGTVTSVRFEIEGVSSKRKPPEAYLG